MIHRLYHVYPDITGRRRVEGPLGAVTNWDGTIGMLNEAQRLAGLALSLNAPAAPLKLPPVSEEAIARLIVPLMRLPLAVTLLTVTGPPESPVMVRP